MKVLSILIVLIIPFAGISQTTFRLQIGTACNEIPSAITQKGDYYYVAYQCKPEHVSSLCDSYLIKLNANGEKVKEVHFDAASDSGYYLILKLVFLNDTEFLVFGCCRENNLEYGKFWIMKMDTAFNIIWDKRYKTDNKYFIQTIYVNKYGDESFLVGADLTIGPPDWYQKLVFLKTNNNGDSIAMTYFTQGDPYTARLKALTYIDNHFKIYTTGFGAFIPYYYGGLAIIDFDTCFNIMGYSGIPYDISSYNYIENLNDSVYLLAGHTTIAGTSNSWDLAIAKYNLNNEGLGFNHYNYSQQAREYPGWLKCLSVADENSIYVGGWTNGDGYVICPYLDQIMVLVNYDSALNMRWARFYGGDACYSLSVVQATTDGGCIIGGMYYDPSNPGNLLDAVIIKVDSLGLVTNVPGMANISSHDAILYPNPGHDYFTIRSGPQIEGARFLMYDIKGCLIFETLMNDTYIQQDMSGLSSGTYPWKIIFKDKLIESGKWIKN